MSLKIVAAASAVVLLSIVGGSHQVSAQEDNKPAEQPKMVAVQPGDSLEKIAAANATTYKRIFDANAQISDPDVIHPGDQVRIPKADEQLAERPLPSKAPAVSSNVKSYGQRTSARPAAAASGNTDWDRLAQCEAGGNWNTNTGNGYSGGLQFSDSSWRAVGGSGKAANASREEQIARAEQLKARQGMGAWPACSSKLGLR